MFKFNPLMINEVTRLGTLDNSVAASSVYFFLDKVAYPKGPLSHAYSIGLDRLGVRVVKAQRKV